MVKHFHRKHFYKKAGTISTTRIIANEINLSDKIDSFSCRTKKRIQCLASCLSSRNIAIYIYGQQDFTNMSLMGGVTVFNTLRPTAAS
jgi:hypothetical protein